MTERMIQRWLYWSRRSTAMMMMPNYAPRKWFECDLWLVTKAGYFYEFEIKLSRSDFLADRRKGGGVGWSRQDGRYQKNERLTKYQRIEKADPIGPSRFWYVVHQSLAEMDFPDWCGVLIAKPVASSVCCSRLRDAPRIHRGKADQSTIGHAKSVTYYRYWTEILRSPAEHDPSITGASTGDKGLFTGAPKS